MTDLPPDDRPDASAMTLEPVRRARLGGVSLVWLVPFFALAIAVAMAWSTFADRGPLIEISFENADGVVENDTHLKYRDVNVGIVEDVRFSPDLTRVIVGVRIDKNIADFIDTEAQFWIVQPEISAQGIRGLGTLLGGVYLEGTWDNVPGEGRNDFEGLDIQPLFSDNDRGVEFVLSAPRGGSISAGAPLIYKGVNVGLIDRPVLAPDGSGVTARAFVRAPYDRLVTTGSRFWNASGVEVTLGATGVDVQIANLTALVQGGIAFDTFSATGSSIERGHVFQVHRRRDDADIGTGTGPQDEGLVVGASALFEGSISGLNNGAPVEYRGLRIGTVAGTGGLIAPAGASQALLLRADLDLSPARVGIEGDDFADVTARTRALLAQLVSDGYRARIVSDGLLGTSLKVQLALIDDADPADLGETSDGRLLIPSAAQDVTDPVNTARAAITRINNLPIEDIVDSVALLLENVNRVLASDGTRAAPEAILGLVRDMRDLVTAPAVQGAADNAAAGLATVNTILTRFEQSAAIDSILSALERSDAIAASVQTALTGLPDLAAQLAALAGEAAALPLDQLTDEVQALLAAATDLLQSDAAQAAPAALLGALQQIESGAIDLSGLTARVAQSGVVVKLISALDRTNEIAVDIEASTQALPAVVAQIETLLATANDLPLNALTARATDVLAGMDAVLADPATQAVPAQLGATLDTLTAAVADVQAVASEVTQSGAVEAVTAALLRADSIAQSLDTTAAGLPDLLARIDAVAAVAQDLPLEDLVRETTALVAKADALVGSDDTARIPAALSAALSELAATLDALRDGGVIENTNAALASAASAADAVAAATALLPDLAARLDGLVAQSEALIGAYGGRSEFNAQTLAALRDLRDSARAVTALARTIERKPNALLIGR